MPASPSPTSPSPRHLSSQRPSPHHLTDEELIETWQSFRRAAGALDHRLVMALRDSAHPDEMWCEALAQLARAPQARLTMTALGSALGIASGVVTRLVDRLAAEGLVRREHADGDRRVVYTALTKRGQEAEHLSTRAYAANLRADLGGLGPQRLQMLRTLSVELEQTLSRGRRQPRTTPDGSDTSPFGQRRHRPAERDSR